MSNSTISSWVPEWSAHRACYVAWPHLETEWEGDLAPVRHEWSALVAALVAGGEKVVVLVDPSEAEVAVRDQLDRADCGAVELVSASYGDIWLRDTGPLFIEVSDKNRERTTLRALRPEFNGWGQKYVMPGDTEVALAIAQHETLSPDPMAIVLEGGAVEGNGAGVFITTRACIHDPKRNPDLTQEAAESLFAQHLKAKKVIWLERGLKNDHTDGHVDTLARFSSENTVLCMKGAADDPNHEVLEQVEETLRAATDAQDHALEVVTVPSPGSIPDAAGNPLPASYMNFVLTANTVIVPTYNSPHDDAAVTAIGEQFSSRKTVGLPARAILGGGGAFHCMTKEVPQPRPFDPARHA